MAARVLLVDDAVEARGLVRMALRLRGGFEIVGEAGDGAGAVRLAGAEQPDIVVLDLGLPDLAGHEVLSGIRRESPDSKVIVFSGLEADDDAWIAQQVEGFVLKDGDVDFLVDLLETVVREPTTAETTAEATLDLPRSLASPGRARRFVAEKVAEWRLDTIRDDALLVVSELAANAITHAGSACRIRLSLTPTTLRIDVIDTGSGTPEPQPPSRTEEHGRGLHLVDALTRAWGLEMVDEGKLVWAELARPS
jgi:DNA-binding NarL/FixJ family response regulator